MVVWVSFKGENPCICSSTWTRTRNLAIYYGAVYPIIYRLLCPFSLGIGKESVYLVHTIYNFYSVCTRIAPEKERRLNS